MDFIAEIRRLHVVSPEDIRAIARIRLWSPKKKRRWPILGAVLQCIEMRFENVDLPKLG